MVQHLEAIYENGVLRPLGRLALAESQRVQLIVSDQSPVQRTDQDIVEWARAEVAAASHIPTIEEARAILSKVPGNMAEDVMRERGDY